jgi:KUP system potassium uptake protein
MAQVQVQVQAAAATMEMMLKKPQASSCCSDDMADLERALALEVAAPTTVPRQDSLYRDATRAAGGGNHEGQDGWARTLRLAFQCVGVLYGDIGTSPLYVYSSTFTGGIRHTDDLLGVLSLIIYSFLLFTIIKYVYIALRANDDGDGTYVLAANYRIIFFNEKRAHARSLKETDRFISCWPAAAAVPN